MNRRLKPSVLLGFLLGIIVAACGAPSATSNIPDSSGTEPRVIVLTQTGCQFLETEEQNYQFMPTSAADCNQINGDTLAEREPEFKPLELSAGDYIFRVTNQNVPYELGFFLRGKGAGGATLPRVSGGGLAEGITQDYLVSLRPGEYVFSCPLNPTPDYPLVVQ